MQLQERVLFGNDVNVLRIFGGPFTALGNPRVPFYAPVTALFNLFGISKMTREKKVLNLKSSRVCCILLRPSVRFRGSFKIRRTR